VHEPVPFIVPELITVGNVTIVGGEPNVGKSRFWTQAGWYLSTNTPFFWPSTPPLRVLFLTERDSKEVWTQMQTLHVPLPPNDNYVLFSVGDMGRAEAAEFNRNPLEVTGEHIRRFDAQIVIADTLAQLITIPAAKHNFNDYGSTVIVMRTLKQWCYQHQIALIGLHHLRKQTVNDDQLRRQDRTLGSQAVAGGSGNIWMMTSLTGEDLIPTAADLYMQLDTSSHSTFKRPPFFFRWGKDRPFEACTEQEATSPLIASSKASGGLQKAILQTVTLRPAVRSEIVSAVSAATGSDSHNVQKALKRLIDSGDLAELTDSAGVRQIFLRAAN